MMPRQALRLIRRRALPRPQRVYHQPRGLFKGALVESGNWCCFACFKNDKCGACVYLQSQPMGP
jgi:hypothetical protein